MRFVPPKFQTEAFTCPHCQAYSQMCWSELIRLSGTNQENLIDIITGFYIARCAHCNESSVWKVDATLRQLQTARINRSNGRPYGNDPSYSKIYPFDSFAPLPNPDLPEDCIDDYKEASNIVVLSPRGAAALLRLVVEKLCKQLGDPSKNIDQNIALLVQKGLPTTIQQALDSVRVIGSAAVHPNIMDIKDDQATVMTLFKLVNIIVEKMITEPKEINAIFESLPESRIENIAKRDKSKQAD
ncbi:DUF4145 domain-containing protein [Neisseriaceae bacterium TC5R-5]|nr:DUF4145 domain-containing protein [Neisseriaceae bacterium TC5R-5]